MMVPFSFRCSNFAALLVGASVVAIGSGYARGQSESIEHVFPTVPREVSQGLSRVRELTADRRNAEAALSLADLLQRLGGQDYFLHDSSSRIARGFRREMWRELATIDSATIELYENMRGVEAQRLLDDALAHHDLTKLSECARHWFLTRAGQQAALILARVDLDQNRPRVAIRRLRDLQYRAAADRIEPERSILHARALAHLDRLNEAEAVLQQLPAQFRAATVRVGEQDLRLFAGDQPARELLAPRQRTTLKPVLTNDWRVFRGDLARSAVVPILTPTDQIQWQEPLLQDTERVDGWRNELADLDTPQAPVAIPLAVAGEVVVRGLDRLLSFDARTGRKRWSYPPELNWQRDTAATATNSTSWLNQRNAQRLWKDNSYGRFSSDGRRVFFIDHLEPAEDANQLAIARQRAAFGRTAAPITSTHNVLVALDIAREGSFLWMVGDVNGQSEPELAGAFFLGPPLPVEGVLYAVAEIKEQVRLVALDPATGDLLWSLAISQLDAQSIGNFPARRFAGSSPAYDNGILVCPTFAGGVVAIDVMSRSFLWGFQFRDLRKKVRSAAAAPFGLPTTNIAGQDIRWRNSDVMLVGSHVLVANEMDNLFCLDAETGAERWNRRRGDIMYMEAIGQEAVLLIGEYRFSAVRVEDGNYLWPQAQFVAIPGGGSPSGRGISDGARFYLPTTDPELLCIQIEDGRVERLPLQEPLGNLIVSSEGLFAQSETHVHALLNRESPNRHSPNRELPNGETAPAEERSSTPGPPRPTGEQLAAATLGQLLDQLASDHFALREAATQELVRRQQEAIPALATGTQSANADVAFRCASALIALLDSPDPDVVIAARQPLLAASMPAAKHRFAGSVYGWEARKRSPAVIRELQRLGAAVQSSGKVISASTNWRGGNDGLVHLLWLPQTEALELRHPSIDDQALGYVRGLPQLKSLNLHRSMVTSAGLKQIVDLPCLETLLIQGTQVDDGAVETLARMAKLRAINLLDTKLTRAGVDRLQLLLPHAKILY